MRIKQRSDDFRVRELLAAGYLKPQGEFRVYRVTKSKLTSFEAAAELARAAGVAASDVSMAGLKDRQGVTVQHMSIRRGRDVSMRSQDLSIETVGGADEPLTSAHSEGNAFEIAVRGLEQEDLVTLRRNVLYLRDNGLVNYFDEQRFGNLRHNQGWIAQQLMRGEHEEALKKLLCALSDHDNKEAYAFKTALLKSWGDWSACREVAGRFGQHHSVFEHLKNNEGDFAGAFFHVASRLRLIHLYAFQSHVWNRAVASWINGVVPEAERVVLEALEGPLVFPSAPFAGEPSFEGRFRLPGPGLEDVTNKKQLALLEDALAHERMVAADFRIDGVPGFQLKGEDRELFIHAQHIRVRPPVPDALNRGLFMLKVRFELPRGAYATLVIRRLLSSPQRSAGRERGAMRGDAQPPRDEARREGGFERKAPYQGSHDRDHRGRREANGAARQHRESGEGRERFDGPRERRPWQDRSRDGGQRDDRPREDRPPFQRSFGERSHNDPPRDDRPRQDRPYFQRSFGDRPRDDRPRDDRPRQDRPYFQRPHNDRPPEDRARDDRGHADRRHFGRQRDDRPQGDRPQFDRQRDDRPRQDRPYVARPYGERPRYDGPRNDRPRDDRGGGYRGRSEYRGSNDQRGGYQGGGARGEHGAQGHGRDDRPRREFSGGGAPGGPRDNRPREYGSRDQRDRGPQGGFGGGARGRGGYSQQRGRDQRGSDRRGGGDRPRFGGQGRPDEGRRP